MWMCYTNPRTREEIESVGTPPSRPNYNNYTCRFIKRVFLYFAAETPK